MPLHQLVAEILFVRTSYVKKIIEDCSNSEETIKLLRFCCWENPQFSSTVLSELLWQVKNIESKNIVLDIDLLMLRYIQQCWMLDSDWLEGIFLWVWDSSKKSSVGAL